MSDVAGFANVKKRQTAMVIFQGGETQGMPVPLTSPGFRHVWLVLPAHYPEPGLMAEVFSMKIEYLRWGVDAAIWWRPPEVVAKAFLDAGVTAIIEFPFTAPNDHPRFVKRGLMTCVTLTKAILQIDDWKVWTPKQLFAYLVRHGGRLYQP